MSAADLQSKAFTDDNVAREAIEALLWPHGPVCAHCGSLEKLGKVEGKSARPGLYYCGACKSQFTVTVGTIFERSKVPLSKWWTAIHLMGCSIARPERSSASEPGAPSADSMQDLA